MDILERRHEGLLILSECEIESGQTNDLMSTNTRQRNEEDDNVMKRKFSSDHCEQN